MRLRILIGVSIFAILLTIGTSFLFPVYSKGKGIRIENLLTVKGVDEKLRPIQATKAFPAGTSNVYCWFQWNNAKSNTAIMVSWYYATDDIHILDYTFDIPRKYGQGSVSLSMPQDKELPAGRYRVELKKDERVLGALAFEVLEKT